MLTSVQRIRISAMLMQRVIILLDHSCVIAILALLEMEHIVKVDIFKSHQICDRLLICFCWLTCSNENCEFF